MAEPNCPCAASRSGFLRPDFARRRIITRNEAMNARYCCWVEVVGVVLVRQRPRSTKVVLLITLGDETGSRISWSGRPFSESIAASSWEQAYSRSKDVHSAGASRPARDTPSTDMSQELASIGKRNAPFPLLHGRGDDYHKGSLPDPRGMPRKGLPVRDIYTLDLHTDRLRVKPRDFR